jgi:hypothetical protein
MKQTAIQQAIAMVKSRIESMDETLMGKHTAHHLQQVERLLYDLLIDEKEQIIEAYRSPVERAWNTDKIAEQYYNQTYGDE